MDAMRPTIVAPRTLQTQSSDEVRFLVYPRFSTEVGVLHSFDGLIFSLFAISLSPLRHSSASTFFDLGGTLLFRFQSVHCGYV